MLLLHSLCCQHCCVCFYDSVITSQLLLQTPGRRTGSSCRLHSHKQSSSQRTFTLWHRWALESWRTAKLSTSKESSLSTTSAWWRSRSTCATRWVMRLHWRTSDIFVRHQYFLFCWALLWGTVSAWHATGSLVKWTPSKNSFFFSFSVMFFSAC